MADCPGHAPARRSLADEPTGDLDQATGTEIMELLIKTASRHNTALVLITHDEKLATQCNRIIRMQMVALPPTAEGLIP